MAAISYQSEVVYIIARIFRFGFGLCFIGLGFVGISFGLFQQEIFLHFFLRMNQINTIPEIIQTM